MTRNRRGWRHAGVARSGAAWVIAALAAMTAGCGAAEPAAGNLKASFAAQVEGVASVSAFERDGDALAFTETRADGDEIQWRVTIDSAVVGPPPGGAPRQGHVVASWYADGELIAPLGSMSRLPDAFLEAGVAQECYALWDAEAGDWDW